jgi:hypothetical protein
MAGSRGGPAAVLVATGSCDDAPNGQTRIRSGHICQVALLWPYRYGHMAIARSTESLRAERSNCAIETKIATQLATCVSLERMLVLRCFSVKLLNARVLAAEGGCMD